MGKMESGSGDVVTFLFQLGLVRDSATVDTSLLTLKTLKEEACKFILKKVCTNIYISVKTVSACGENEQFHEKYMHLYSS
jgi:hypothetical protein